jgi:oligoendopeptidase F
MMAALAPLAASAGDDTEVKDRSDVPEQYRWNLATTFATDDDWKAEYAAVDKLIDELAKLRGTLSQSDTAMLTALKLRDDSAARLERVYVYAGLTADQDTRDNKGQEMRARCQALGVKFGQAVSWMDPEITAIPFEKIKGWMDNNPDLAVYRHAMDDLFRQKKHILTPREEELIAMAGQVFETPGSGYNLLANADLAGMYPKILDADGDEVEVSDSAFYVFMRDPDRRVRRDAYNGIVGTYAKVRNVSAALLNGEIQSHVFNVRARGYDSCLAAALDGANIPTTVYDTLVTTVNENLPLLHRYEAIRRKALKLSDGVHAYDLFAPFVDQDPLKCDYTKAVETMYAALEPLGSEYVNTVKKGVNSRWIDAYPTRGKRSGAYSSGTYLTQPYILLNYRPGYDEVSTLVHEMGHSMHSYLSRGTQPYVYSRYDIFCAEVASTTNEVLLQQYVLPRIEDPQAKLALLVELLETFRGTVFRQTMFSEYEQHIHQMAERGEPLTADSLGAAYREIMTRYYGPDYVHDDMVDNYWLRIPHFYYNFYVYKYATSYCAACNIARRIKEGQPGAVEAYLNFLKGGCSKYPVELLKDAGVDMTTAEPVNDAMRVFEQLLDETEELLNQVE